MWGGRCSKREDEDGRTRAHGRPSGRGSTGRKRGEQQGGRRVLLRADFRPSRQVASRPFPQGRHFALPLPIDFPAKGCVCPASSSATPAPPCPRAGPRPQVLSPSRPDPGRRAHLADGHPRLSEPLRLTDRLRLRLPRKPATHAQHGLRVRTGERPSAAFRNAGRFRLAPLGAREDRAARRGLGGAENCFLQGLY